MSKLIYLDNAATTALRPEALKEMLPYLEENYANPSSVYDFAQKAKKALEDSRDTIAKLIGAKEKEIYFTSGGSEGDNWALLGVAEKLKDKGNHIITTKIEHHAVLHACEHLEKMGYEVTYLDVDENGLVTPEAVEAAIKPSTILISIMFANNEIGTIEPIEEIGEVAAKHDILFHTDAVQAFAHVPIDVEKCHIDMLSASGHKFHGPKGVGFFYMKESVKLGAFIHGGAQERSRRAGTHNVPGIVGMAAAAKLACEEMEENGKRESELRDYTIDRILEEVPYCRLNGDRVHRLPNNINICFRFIEGESMLIMLDQKGICASSGSACTSGSLDPSHVLLAIGLPHEIAHGSLRLTLSAETTKEDMDYVVDSVKANVERLRSMSPLYEDFLRESQ